MQTQSQRNFRKSYAGAPTFRRNNQSNSVHKMSKSLIEILPTFLEKEVRQRENILLKSANNNLRTENQELKTKIKYLNEEVRSLTKKIQADTSLNCVIRMNSTSLQNCISNLQKKLDDAVKQNTQIKKSIRCTNYGEVQAERDAVYKELLRLRKMYEDQKQAKTALKQELKNQSQRFQAEITKIQNGSDALVRQNMQLQRNAQRAKQNEEYCNPQKVLRGKDKERILECKIKRKDEDIKQLQAKISKLQEEMHQFQRKSQQEKNNIPKKEEKEIRGKLDCDLCSKAKSEAQLLKNSIASLQGQISKLKSILPSQSNCLMKNPIKTPSQDERERVRRFLIHRFKAFQLPLSQVMRFLLYSDRNQPEQLISVKKLFGVLRREPFKLLTDRYLETLIIQLCYKTQSQTGSGFTIQQSMQINKDQIGFNFINFIGQYEPLDAQVKEELSLMATQLVSLHQINILEALDQKKTSENTVSQQSFSQFFKDIAPDQLISYMISQIILDSLDLDHLNLAIFFETFAIHEEQSSKQKEKQQKPSHVTNSIVIPQELDYVVPELPESQQQSKIIPKKKTNLPQKESPEQKLLQKSEEQKLEVDFRLISLASLMEHQKKEVKVEQQTDQQTHIKNTQEYSDDYQF